MVADPLLLLYIVTGLHLSTPSTFRRPAPIPRIDEGDGDNGASSSSAANNDNNIGYNDRGPFALSSATARMIALPSSAESEQPLLPPPALPLLLGEGTPGQQQQQQQFLQQAQHSSNPQHRAFTPTMLLA